MNFIKKLYRFVFMRLYVNDCVIIYKHKEHISVSSIAQIQKVKSNSLQDVLQFQHPKYVKIFQNFLSLGDKGYYAYLGKKCIHRSWVKGNEQIVYPHWAYLYKLKDNEVFIHYCETAPEARGKRIYPHVLSTIAEEYKDKNILISVNDKNIASKKGIEKVGFKEVIRIKILIILGIKYIKEVRQND